MQRRDLRPAASLEIDSRKAPRSLRIALFSTSWFDFYVVELARALSARHQVLVFVDQHDTLMHELQSPNIRVVRVPWFATRKKPLHNVLSLRRILREIKAFKPDVLHFQEHDPRVPALMPFIGRYGVVLDLHNVQPLAGMEHPLRDWFRDFTRKRIGAFVVHGTAMAIALRARYRASPPAVFALPFGRFSTFGGAANERVNPAKPVVLFFGRIEPYKGVETLVAAEPLIEKSFGPNFQIQIVGSGDLAPYFTAQRDVTRFQIVNERVKDPSPWFRRADIVVMPHNEASTSGVTPVAYAHEKPVVVTDTGSLAETVDEGRTGFVVPTRDPAALAEAIVKLLSDSSLRVRMGIAGREMLDGPLAWSRNMGNLEAAYEHAARRA